MLKFQIRAIFVHLRGGPIFVIDANLPRLMTTETMFLNFKNVRAFKKQIRIPKIVHVFF